MANLSDSPELFGAFVAELNDPFARRANVLREHQVSEEDIARLTAGWAPRLRDDAALRARYSAAFKGKKDDARAASAAASSGVSVPGARDVVLHPPQGPAPPLLDQTLSVVMGAPGAGTPFVARDDLGIPLDVAAAAARLDAHVDTGTLHLEGREDLTPVTPFEAARAAPSSDALDDDDGETVELRVDLAKATK
jgi:hypothetical protein